MKKFLWLFIPMLSGSPAFAADGKALHEANCTQCHDSSVYTREDHFVTSREQLVSQVRRCEANLDLTWFDEDVNAVVDYLDRDYYKFEKTSSQ
ncbi:MAG: cytochrome c [Thiogranum sp.]|nr:cytochrome c [Thiogranum sp.]